METAVSSKIKATPEFGTYIPDSGVDFLPLSLGQVRRIRAGFGFTAACSVTNQVPM